MSRKLNALLKESAYILLFIWLLIGANGIYVHAKSPLNSIYAKVDVFNDPSLILLQSLPFRVIDGDTIKVDKDSYRLFGIDAPELSQECESENKQKYPCGLLARDALTQLIGSGHNVYMHKVANKDKYGRGIIELFYFDGKRFINLNAEMIYRGHAIWYKHFAKAFTYELAQRYAIIYNSGICSGSFVEPYQYRKKQKKENSEPTAFVSCESIFSIP